MTNDAGHHDDALTSTKGKWGGLSILDRIDATGDCWEWTGSLDSKGYGQLKVNKRRHSVHRFIWINLVGPIPDGLELDHMCRNTMCCNPDHLEPVPHQENQRRSYPVKSAARSNLRKAQKAAVATRFAENAQRAFCHSGRHKWVDANITRYGERARCRLCSNERSRRWQRQRRASA